MWNIYLHDDDDDDDDDLSMTVRINRLKGRVCTHLVERGQQSFIEQ